MFAVLFLGLSGYGLFMAYLIAFNPKGIGDRMYRFSKRTSTFGRVKFGIFFLTDDPTFFRWFSVFVGVCLFVFGLATFIALA